jgi:hypothetical protein
MSTAVSRVTRSQARNQTEAALPAVRIDLETTTLLSTLRERMPSPPPSLPHKLTMQHTGLSRKAHTLLLRKQQLLRSIDLAVDESTTIANSIRASLAFAAHQAGTAVCIAPDGLLLTCAHCVAETQEELADVANELPWLMFADGHAVQAEVLKWDARRDLALLRIVHAQSSISSGSFPHCPISAGPTRANSKLLCVGHPGSEDLESPASKSGQLRATGYDVLCVSRGRYRGLARGQDPQDNSEIGALMHDCWTFWGHSGAPLIEDGDTGGRLVGLHSSWDDETGMRRGVDLLAIVPFLQEWDLEERKRSRSG